MESESSKMVGQSDLDGWMNAPCKIMGTHKVRAPWWLKEEAKHNVDKR